MDLITLLCQQTTCYSQKIMKGNSTVGQCHPKGHKITWMMTIQKSKFDFFTHEFSSFKNNGEWKPSSMEKGEF